MIQNQKLEYCKFLISLFRKLKKSAIEIISIENIEDNMNLNIHPLYMPRKEGYTFVVDEDRCFGCAACIALCPVNVLDLENKLAIVDEKNCTHCRLCIPSCPVFALDIKPEI